MVVSQCTTLATPSADILNCSSLERHSTAFWDSVEENGIGCTDRQEKDGFCLMCLTDCKDCVNVRRRHSTGEEKGSLISSLIYVTWAQKLLLYWQVAHFGIPLSA